MGLHESIYELFFNQSQGLLKKQMFGDSIKTLLKSHELANEEQSY